MLKSNKSNFTTKKCIPVLSREQKNMKCDRNQTSSNIKIKEEKLDQDQVVKKKPWEDANEEISQQFHSDCALKVERDSLGIEKKNKKQKIAESFSPNIRNTLADIHHNTNVVIPPVRVKLRNITNRAIPKTKKMTIYQGGGCFEQLPRGCSGVIRNGKFNRLPKKTSVSFFASLAASFLKNPINDTSSDQDNNNSMGQKQF